MEELMAKYEPLNFKLAGQNGNAFVLMGVFSGAARKAKWAKADIDKVLEEAMSGDYDHLLKSLILFQA